MTRPFLLLARIPRTTPLHSSRRAASPLADVSPPGGFTTGRRFTAGRLHRWPTFHRRAASPLADVSPPGGFTTGRRFTAAQLHHWPTFHRRAASPLCNIVAARSFAAENNRR
ncbi:hypothetical protein ACN4D8_05065 [Corynebacterium macclintockiae]|uniref:hypothetical protein n=1 Tax=Corynebacterium macclintockiae TaxID=2913501 RepID=UPI003EBBA6FD